MSNEPVLQAKNLSKRFEMEDKRILTAVDDVSLNLYKGKTLGIVGESGCGKSTFARMLVQLDQPSDGEILYRGKNIQNLKGKDLWGNRRHIQMVFQDPLASFNPRMKVREIICEPLLNYKLIKKSEKNAVAARYLQMVELPEDFMERYPHALSGGQRQRVNIARALALEPEIIICDEATCALDVSCQDTIVQLLVRLQEQKNLAMGFICHDVALVSSLAHDVAVMYLGNVVEKLPGEDLINKVRHPYTKALIDAIFDLKMDFSKKIEAIEGETPSPLNAPQGCPFQDRCPECMAICKEQKPLLQTIDEGHLVACHLELN
ncbi:MAG: ABC transporter ATP-binding protein [Eubacteriaceae bacterium]